MRVAVLQFERWESTDGVTDFGATLTEFEQNVKPDPAHLAIGFSSQHRFGAGRHRVGGIRGPLSSHILIRESAPHVLEKERLEVLVHELGHYFGAAHSDQRTSVMRPTLGDGQARAAAFRIGFDAENGAIVRIVAGEINTFRVRRFTDISADGRRNLIAQYERLARRMPDDPTAARYIQVLRSTSVPLPRRSPGQLP